jgi:predicted transposase/invertase (TIGR01784 family)
MSPKTDFAFKKIFGGDKSKNILISFLNSIIYAEKKVIQDLEIINPYNPPSVTSLKDSYLDVKATLDNKTTVIVEMQVINLPAFNKRIIYNLAKTYANQLKSGQGYTYLNPVISLTIMDFELFNEVEDVITFWVFKEQTKLIDYVNEELKMVFVELPKFPKKLEELETITDKWLYFIKEAPSLELIPDNMGEISEIKEALNIANVANLSEKELDDLHHQEVFAEDQRGLMSLIIKAEEKGRGEGREEGIVIGEANVILRLLERKLGAIPADLKTTIQKLSSEKLASLSEAIFDFNSVNDLINFLNC